MKMIKKGFVCLLLISVCISMMSTAAFAEETVLSGEKTAWQGNEVSKEVVSGTEEYAFLSVYPGRAYEMSNHMVSADGGSSNSIPQSLVMIEADRDYTWIPDGTYSFGSSNYEVLYCCDADTGYSDNVYYKRVNLEDSQYYDAEDAAHIRSIITNSYPYVSLEQMKANLAAEGFAEAENLTRADVIAAVQTAVWAYANNSAALRYSHTFDIPSNPQWGKVFHDYTNEMEVWWAAGKRVFSVNETVGARIDALAEHLKSQNAVYAEKNQIVITSIKIADAIPVQEKEGMYKVAVQAYLNNSGSSLQDEIFITVSVDGKTAAKEKAVLGAEEYNWIVEAAAGQTIDVSVSGIQLLPEGAYFYQPEGGRHISQCLVGVAAGRTPVSAEASVTLDIPETEPVTADLILQKTSKYGRQLDGAVFSLEAVKENLSFPMGIYAVYGEGQMLIENLLPGDYQLRETEAPMGYRLLSEPIDFKVTDDGEIVLSGHITGVSVTERQNDYLMTVQNRLIPSPGGSGGGSDNNDVPEVVIPEEPAPEEQLPEEPVPEEAAPAEEEPAVQHPVNEEDEPEASLTDNPKTFDSADAALWGILAAMSAGTLVIYLFRVKRCRRGR